MEFVPQNQSTACSPPCRLTGSVLEDAALSLTSAMSEHETTKAITRSFCVLAGHDAET